MFLERFFAKKVYDVQIPSHLIQSIRVYQCLMEAGLTIKINRDQEETFEYLKKHFTVRYSSKEKAVKNLDIEISHNVPYVRMGSYRQPLVFSNEVFQKCRALWSDKRATDLVFVGLVTPGREKYFKDKKKQLNDSRLKLKITNSDKGRVFPYKAWDEDYYKEMGAAKFVLCPNGDFIWTYRFFEAILCGAIPVVEEECELYKDFIYHTSIHDNLEWDRGIALHNFDKAKDLLGAPSNLRKLLNI